MKHKYRIIDAVVQVLILITWAAALIAKSDNEGLVTVIACGWFLISLIIHAFVSSNKYKERYTKIAVAICCMLGGGIICLLCPGLLYILIYCSAYATPVLPLLILAAAIAYTCICLSEIRYLNKRPISLLK